MQIPHLARNRTMLADVVKLMATGASNEEIGRAFKVSDHAVARFLYEYLYPELGVVEIHTHTKRVAAVAQAYEKGILVAWEATY